MQKRFLGLILALFIILPGATASAADYSIDLFSVRTWIFDESEPKTTFRYMIIDADNANHVVIEDVVQSVTITEPTSGFSQTSTSPELRKWAFIEFRGTDSNPQDGVIDPNNNELEKIANTRLQYEIVSTTSPHAEGTYTIEITFNTAHAPVSTSVTVAGGKTATELPPSTNVDGAFNEQNIFQVSWNLPAAPYPTDSNTEVRVDRYQSDGTQRYIRYSARNLPPTTENVSFQKWESDVIKTLAPFIRVSVWVYADSGVNVAQAAIQEYAVNGTILTPTEITPPMMGDVNMDGKIGLEEAIHALRVASGIGPLTDEAAAIADGIAAAISAFNNKDMTDLMSYFSEDYLDHGSMKTELQTEIQADFDEDPFEPIVYSIISINVDGNTATAIVEEGDGEKETWYFRKEGDTWKIYGDQQLYYIDVYSAHHMDGNYTGNIIIDDEHQRIISASATGTGMPTGGVVLGKSTDGRWWGLPGDGPYPDLGTSPPSAPPTYVITIVDDMGTHTVERSITGYVEEFASNLSPTGNVTGMVTFSWTGISNADGYTLSLENSNYERIWDNYEIEPTASNAYSIVYDGPTLTPGETYHYHIGSHINTDGNWNGSFSNETFSYSDGSTPTAVTVDFDDLDTSAGAVSGTVLYDYLAGFGITATDVVSQDPSQYSVSVVADALNGGEINVVASSTPNVLNPPFGTTTAYTLVFDTPIDSFGFTRTGYCTSLSYPSWTATAEDIDGTVLDTISETSGSTNADCSSPNPPGQTFSFSNTGIKSVTFESGSVGTHGRTGPAIDDLILN